MSKRVCPVPSCPNLTDGGRCAEHRRQAEQARGTRQARGYGPNHDRLRAKWADLLASGTFLVLCCRCSKPISSDEPWHLDHTDDRTGYLGPSHESCNTRAPRIRDGQ